MDVRTASLQRLIDNPRVPVLIVGGGVNGVGLLRELALQGVSCVLVDKADFCAGASSKSSRMIHGGLRYLEHRQFALVRESLLERNRLLRNAPHYVKPLKTTIPLYSRLGGLPRSAAIFLGFSVRPGGRGSLVTRLGLMFYDFVTRKDRRTPTHYLAGRRRSLAEIPGLNDKVVATATYWDAVITEAERLCVEMVNDALAANPQCIALNYVAVEATDGPRVFLRDVETGQSLSIEPSVVVNATGAWVDKANAALGIQSHFMGPTKGSHLVVDCPPLLAALGDRMVYYQHVDGRVCIVFPFQGKVIMGSTDIPVSDPDEARCDESEVQYMLQTLRGVFPGIDIPRQSIVYTYCGVRPLPAADTSVTANISRGHTIRRIEPEGGRPFPVYCLIGGKWTTFRALAEQAADEVLSRLGIPRRCGTEDLPIGGGRLGGGFKGSSVQELKRAAPEPLNPEALEPPPLAPPRLAGRAQRPLRTLPDYSIEEIQWIAANEHVVHLGDIVYRRSTIGLLGRATPEALAELAEVVGEVLGWDAQRRSEEARRALPPAPEGGKLL